MAAGPAQLTDNDIQTRPFTDTTADFTIGASDTLASALFTCGVIRVVVAGAAGNIAIKRKNDAAFHVYNVIQGQVIKGNIIAIGGTGSGSTGIHVCCEV